MKVSDAIIKCLEKENVDMIFGYPGGAVLPLYESLRTSNIKHILVRQEQSAAHSASGYSRVSGKTGVCIATSGPGATNLITGIATAYMDSIPLVILTGQVNSKQIGKDLFQEADIVGATEPFTKHNYFVKEPKEIIKVLKEAFYIASTGRPGPVLIDIPIDVQKDNIKFNYSKDVKIRGYKPTYVGHTGQVKKAVRKLKESKRPLICAGGGIHCSHAVEELKAFSQKANIPVVHTLMGLGAMPFNSKYYVGMVGSHGHSYSNKVIAEADLLLIVGARYSDRATNNFNAVNNKTQIIHIDIDPAEVGKNIDTNIPVVGDAKNILNQLIKKISPLQTEEWLKTIEKLKSTCCKKECNSNNFVNPQKAVRKLSKMVNDDTILTADVGQNQIWAARNFEIKGKRRYLSSGGLGTMGYSLPAAVGAKLACPSKTVVCVVGDGGIQMNLGELGTLRENGLKIIIVLFNNNMLGMVKELQDMFLGEDKHFGVDVKFNPNFIKLANAYDLEGEKVSSDDEFEEAVKRALKSEKGYIIECKVDPQLNTC